MRQAISKVSEKAGKEYQIEQALEKMASEWENVNLFIDPYVHTTSCRPQMRESLALGVLQQAVPVLPRQIVRFVPILVHRYRETGTFILKGVDDLQTLLDEHVTMTQAMQFSAFKKPFEDRIDR